MHTIGLIPDTRTSILLLHVTLQIYIDIYIEKQKFQKTIISYVIIIYCNTFKCVEQIDIYIYIHFKYF